MNLALIGKAPLNLVVHVSQLYGCNMLTEAGYCTLIKWTENPRVVTLRGQDSASPIDSVPCIVVRIERGRLAADTEIIWMVSEVSWQFGSVTGHHLCLQRCINLLICI